MMTGYVTTFWLTVAFRRICAIVPRNALVRIGVDREADGLARPCTCPMSDSETSAETCIFVRSCAIVKIVGAWKDAATVWPTSYCAVHDDAVDRRDDLAVAQVRLRLLERRLRLIATDATAES